MVSLDIYSALDSLLLVVVLGTCLWLLFMCKCWLVCTIDDGITYKSLRTVPFIMMDCAAAGFGSVSVTMTLSPPNIVYIPSLSNSRGDMRVW